ncbi:MAG: alpha/beta hydrolase [Planctomycetes bacterium]|nr:alpha/beta hydrolase [Planctomycetota bacterium]
MAALLLSFFLASCRADAPIGAAEGNAGGHHRDVDRYVPSEARASLATVLFVPGGGWVRDGRREDREVYKRVGRSIASHGFAAAVMSHRVGGETGYREQAGDVARVLASMFRRSSDTDRSAEGVFLAGFSSGAHLAALVALDPRYLAAEGLSPSVLAGVIGISGVYDLPALAGSESARETLVPAFGPDPRAWVDASPVFHAGPGAPPFLLLAGEEEGAAMAGQAATLAEALRLQGGRARVAILPGRDHDSVVLDFGNEGDPVLAEIAAFLEVP